MKNKIITNSFEDTQKLGEEYAEKIKDGGVLALYGDLGSGKTTFVQGLARGLGVTKKIISPTFIIMRTYALPSHSGKRVKRAHPESMNKERSWTSQDDDIKFYHVDLYRIESENGVEELGLIDLMNEPGNIIVIEWPEKIEKVLPKEAVKMHFTYLVDDKREIALKS